MGGSKITLRERAKGLWLSYRKYRTWYALAFALFISAAAVYGYVEFAVEVGALGASLMNWLLGPDWLADILPVLQVIALGIALLLLGSIGGKTARAVRDAEEKRSRDRLEIWREIQKEIRREGDLADLLLTQYLAEDERRKEIDRIKKIRDERISRFFASLEPREGAPDPWFTEASIRQKEEQISDFARDDLPKGRGRYEPRLPLRRPDKSEQLSRLSPRGEDHIQYKYDRAKSKEFIEDLKALEDSFIDQCNKAVERVQSEYDRKSDERAKRIEYARQRPPEEI